MKKLILLLHFTFGIFHFTFSQTSPGIEWQNTIGGSGEDRLTSIYQTADGGYILGGGSTSNISGDKTENCIGNYDYWIVKTDSTGNVQWQNTIGGSGQENLSSIQQTNDGGYIIGGISESNISGDKTESSNGNDDYWIIKTDANGNIQWQNTIGGSGNDWLLSIQQTTDGGYILGGYSWSNISGDKTENSHGSSDYWVVKTDTIGNIQWQNTIGGTSIDALFSVQQTVDGGYILGGHSHSGISGDKTENNNGMSDFWIVKTDSLGNIQWQNTIGGNDFDALESIQQTTDGGYILGGMSESNLSGDKTENSNGEWDYWIVKTDTIGNIQWQNTIGGAGTDWLYYIQQTADGGYILGGSSVSNISGDKTESCIGSFDYWIVKTDTVGNIQWQNTIGGSSSDRLYSLQQTFDGGFILIGESTSNISGDKTENCIGGSDFWVIKTDFLGNTIWQKTIGGSFMEAIPSIQQTSDLGYILGGRSNSNISGDKTENSIGAFGYTDYWIIKLYHDTTTGITNLQSSTNNIQLFPNPTKNEITMTGYTLQNNQPAQLKIFDVMGKEVLAQSITNLNSHILNLNSITSGVYYLQLNNGKQISTSKFVKM